MSVFGIFHGWGRKRPLLEKFQTDLKEDVLRVYAVLARNYSLKLKFLRDASKIKRDELKEALGVERALEQKEERFIAQAIGMIASILSKESVAQDQQNEEQLRKELSLFLADLEKLKPLLDEQYAILQTEPFSAARFERLVLEEGSNLAIEHNELVKIQAEFTALLAEKPEVITPQEREKRLQDLASKGLDVQKYPGLADLANLLVDNWALTQDLVKKIHPGNWKDVFGLGLPTIHDLVRTSEDLIVIVELVGKIDPDGVFALFYHALPAVRQAGVLKSREDLILLVELAGKTRPEDVFSLFKNAMTSFGVQELVNSTEDLRTLIDLAGKVKPEHVYDLIYDGLNAIAPAVKSHEDFVFAAQMLARVLEKVKGVEPQTMSSVPAELLKFFGLRLFEELLVPCARVQGPGTFLCFDAFDKIFMRGGVTGESDVVFLRYIIEKYPVKAADILRNFILPGLGREISMPVSSEAEPLRGFLKDSPAYVLELYAEYKQLFGTPGFEEIARELFAVAHEMKKNIVDGSDTGIENKKSLFLGVLFHVFSPEISVDRQMYENLLQSRADRQGDIPEILLRKASGLTVKVDTGSIELKEGESVGVDAWHDLAEAIDSVNANPIQVNAARLGIGLLGPDISQNRKSYLAQLYAWLKSQGNSLPPFSNTYESLVKYKEFIGDRLNDVIFSVLQIAQQTHPEEFRQHLGKPIIDYSRLARTLAGLWKSPMKKEDKTARVLNILSQNGFSASRLDWQDDYDQRQIAQWLSQYVVIEKSLIARIKEQLYGEKYRTMQAEMTKYKFTRGEGTKKFTFILSKRKTHSVAMFNMGVCVTPDDELWNSPDMWQMIIFDEENNACGGAIYRTIIEDNKKYLVISINPSQRILSTVNPKAVYDKIIQFSKIMAKLLKYNAVLIPTSETIHSNRTSMQQQITQAKYKAISLKNEYSFSYSPYAYKYKEFYVAA